MAKLNDIQVIASNNFIELMTLKTEVDGMIAENRFREACGNSPTYTETDFIIIAEKMRALKTIEKE